MQNSYTQIQFATVNYSRLQGLRLIPIGLFSASVAVWTIDHQGDLGFLMIAAPVAALLYWLIDYYYANTFGHIRQSDKMRSQETIISILFGALAWLAFWLDMAQNLPFSALGLVFAVMLFEEIWRTTRLVKERPIRLYPESFTLAYSLLILSLLPLTGLAWWKTLGFPSQYLGMLTIMGILFVPTGIWGHLRLLHALPLREVKSDENAL